MSDERRVNFLEESSVLEIESQKEYTKQEILDSFYTTSELETIVFRSVNEARNSTCFLRGLEKFTEQGRKLSAANKDRCINAVMDEQDRQWAFEEDDFDLLAVVSQEASGLSVALAMIRAEEDEQEAQRIYQLMQEQKITASKIDISKPIAWDEQTSICSRI